MCLVNGKHTSGSEWEAECPLKTLKERRDLRRLWILKTRTGAQITASCENIAKARAARIRTQMPAKATSRRFGGFNLVG